MKVLFITENFPYPLDSGGRIRSYHILQGLSQQHDVTLVTSIKNDEQRGYIPKLERLCRELRVTYAAPETSAQLGLKLVRNLISPLPIVVERHYLPGIAAEIEALLNNASPSFDVVHFDHLDASVYLPCLPESVLTVLDEHNIVTNQIKTSAGAERNWLKQAYMRFQQQRTIRYEAETCRKMNLCFVCSDTDKNYLLKMAPAARVVAIPNGVNIEYFQNRSSVGESVSTAEQKEKAVIFVGTLNYGPGATAVRYFCEDILPQIHTQNPEVCFWAVGQNPPTYLQTLAQEDPRIRITGRVDDIRPYVHRSQVFVVPLKSGSGTRLKILDAMAMGIPVVSTSIGAEGLDVQSGEQILLADSPEAFSTAVLQLLKDPVQARRMSEKAFQLVQATYDWTIIGRDLLTAYSTLEQTT